MLKNKDIAKVVLSILYLCEGSKSLERGSVMFGNSDPFIINLFLYLLRRCYNIYERKFRCTLQGRADQDVKKLEKFWSKITNIPLSQFYKARIDSRTIGKKSKNLNYKGVCRIDYFSAEIAIELMQISKIIHKGAYSLVVKRVHGMHEIEVRFPVGPPKLICRRSCLGASPLASAGRKELADLL